MIKRQEFAQELILREQVRKAIKIVKQRRSANKQAVLTQENHLRAVIRDLIGEAQSGVANAARHDSTGINALEDLLKNSNILSVVEKGYKSLTTSKDQRDSYRNHILVAIEKTLAPEESRKLAGEDPELDSLEEDLEEDVSISIDRPEDDPDFIDVEEKEEVVEEPDPKDDFGIEGEDKTGRNMAYTDFQDIEKSILTAFDDLDNTEDSSMFEEYLIKNLALYFDKFEAELETSVSEPAAAADAVADADGAELEDDSVANIELQEVIKHLNLDDIIENLL